MENFLQLFLTSVSCQETTIFVSYLLSVKIDRMAAGEMLYQCLYLPFMGPQHKTDIDMIERVTKITTGTKHHSYEEGLEEMGLFSLERRRLLGDLIVVSSYQKRSLYVPPIKKKNKSLQDREKLSQVSIRTGNGFKTKRE